VGKEAVSRHTNIRSINCEICFNQLYQAAGKQHLDPQPGLHSFDSSRHQLDTVALIASNGKSSRATSRATRYNDRANRSAFSLLDVTSRPSSRPSPSWPPRAPRPRQSKYNSFQDISFRGRDEVPAHRRPLLNNPSFVSHDLRRAFANLFRIGLRQRSFHPPQPPAEHPQGHCRRQENDSPPSSKLPPCARQSLPPQESFVLGLLSRFPTQDVASGCSAAQASPEANGNCPSRTAGEGRESRENRHGAADGFPPPQPGTSHVAVRSSLSPLPGS
jgi:hypothetical protein